MRAAVVALATVALLVTAGCAAPLTDAPGGTAGVDATGTDGTPAASPTPTRAGTDAPTPTATATTAASTPTATPTRTTTPTASARVAVANGSLPANATRTFRRVQALAGTDVAPPGRVVVVDGQAALLPGDGGGNRTVRGTARFQRLLGVAPVPGDVNASMENGVTLGMGAIRLYPGETPTRRAVEPLLAHEYVHYVQIASGQRLDLVRAYGTTRTTDQSYALRSALEGAAVYVETTYVRRHLPQATTGAVRTDRLYRNLTPGSLGRYGQSQYYFGRRYVRSRVDAPAALPSVYETPPATSEQVIHGYAPGVEPPANLTVRVRDDGAAWRGTPSDTLGEAMVRVALENGLDPDRAADAAAGWGTDRLVTFHPTGDGRASYAWVLRWDDAANATAFETALADSIDARGTRDGGTWSVDAAFASYRPTERTVVLAAGNASFVEGLTVLGSGDRVTLRP